ncbi:MAG: hypothetical protein ACRD2G_09230, partial [Terriglobia bacterium]
MAQEATKTQLERPETRTAPEQGLPTGRAWSERLKEAVSRAAGYLLSLQKESGYWIGELEADSTLESDYIFFLHLIGKASPT